jgi:hypothetical protein
MVIAASAACDFIAGIFLQPHKCLTPGVAIAMEVPGGLLIDAAEPA